MVTEGRSSSTPPKQDSGASMDAPYEAGSRVRVWWPPCDEEGGETVSRSGYSGMYWPSSVLSVEQDGLRVEYDNGDVELVSLDNIHPYNPPVKFGEERIPFEVGEFVEVFNASETDPAAWLARVRHVNKTTFTVEYPFHDSPPEAIKPENIRRARLYEKDTRRWMIIKPDQSWEDGEVESPLELETIDGHVLARMLQEKQAQKASANSDDEGDRGKETRARSSLSKLQEPAGSSKRKGKPMRSRT